MHRSGGYGPAEWYVNRPPPGQHRRYADGTDTESAPPTDTVHGAAALAAFAAIALSTALRFRIASIAGIFNGTSDLRPKL